MTLLCDRTTDPRLASTTCVEEIWQLMALRCDRTTDLRLASTSQIPNILTFPVKIAGSPAIRLTVRIRFSLTPYCGGNGHREGFPTTLVLARWASANDTELIIQMQS